MTETTYVAFYRDLNLGQRGSPNRGQLEGALVGAGATTARSFQSNGTVVFTVEPGLERDVVGGAAPVLSHRAGYDGPAFVRELAALVALVDREPFAGLDHEGSPQITFFDGGRDAGLALPWTAPRGDLVIVEIRSGYALSLARRIGSRMGSAGRELEERLGVPATTRGMGTVERLVRKFQSDR